MQIMCVICADYVQTCLSLTSETFNTFLVLYNNVEWAQRTND